LNPWQDYNAHLPSVKAKEKEKEKEKRVVKHFRPDI
jgi:hypothetical protein